MFLLLFLLSPQDPGPCLPLRGGEVISEGVMATSRPSSSRRRQPELLREQKGSGPHPLLAPGRGTSGSPLAALATE